MSIADELEKLRVLREQGALTEEEYILAKKRVIDGEPAPRTRFEIPLQPPSALRELRRSLTDRWIGGVCGGLNDATNVPTWTWRILFVLLAFLHGIGIVLYVLLWIFVPLQKLALPAPAVIVPPAPPPGA